MPAVNVPLSLALVLALAATSAACIEDQRRLAPDASETSAPDDTSAPDTGAPDVDPPDTGLGDGVEPDAPPDDTTNDGADAPDWETATSDCQSDGDCADRTASECHEWVCDRGWCTQTATTGGPCDDGDQCTVDDFCDQGVCAAGWVLTCDMLSPDCWAPTGDTCNPDTGCPGVAAPVGMGCYDGFGLEAGTCYNGWVVPQDRCDGEGLCLDTSGLVPTTIHPLAGTWHTVVVRGPARASLQTLTADVGFSASGNVTLSAVRSTDAPWAEALTNTPTGSFCALLDGQIDLEFGGVRHQGVATPDSSFIVFQGPDATMGLMLRGTGDRDDLNGTYHVVVLEGSDEEPQSYLTRVGQIGLELGCITGPGWLDATVGLGDRIDIAAGNCFQLIDGRWHIPLTLIVNGVSIPSSWSGAIGPDGDIVLLARDDIRLRNGTVLLVRARDQVPDSALHDKWYFASRRGGLGASSGVPRVPVLEAGMIALGDTNDDLFGYLIGEIGSGFLGQWWHSGSAGRYSQRAAIHDEVVHHTGVIAPRPDVIIAWVAQDPETDASRPQTLRPHPKEGSLFVGVRWRAFVD